MDQIPYRARRLVEALYATREYFEACGTVDVVFYINGEIAESTTVVCVPTMPIVCNGQAHNIAVGPAMVCGCLQYKVLPEAVLLPDTEAVRTLCMGMEEMLSNALFACGFTIALQFRMDWGKWFGTPSV